MLPRFKILNEKRVHKYTIPSSKKRQLFDFYLLSALQSLLPLPSVGFRDLDPDLELNITEGVNTLFPALRRDLLDAVFYSINAELRHTYQHKRINQELVDTTFTDKEKAAYEYLKEYRDAHLRGSSNKVPDAPSSGDRPPESEKVGSQFARNVMYKGAMYAIKKSGMTLSEWVTMCGKFFKDGAWFGGYGGKAWYEICEGWLMLNNATSISGNMGVMSMLQKGAKKPEMQIPMGVAIDYIYDLQHNTGSVLNKLKSYYEGGYSWLAEALDFKRYIKSLHELLPHVSSTLKQIALPVLKNKLGDTQESLKQISIGSEVKLATTLMFSELYSSSKQGYTAAYIDSSKEQWDSDVTFVQVVDAKVHATTKSNTQAADIIDQIYQQGKVFGLIQPHTIYCVEIDINNIDDTFINDKRVVYELRKITDNAIETVQYNLHYTNKFNITEVGPKTLPLTTELAFFGWEKAFKYIDMNQQLEDPTEPKATEDKSGAYINSDLDYADKMIDSMSSGTEDINLDDDYYESKY